MSPDLAIFAATSGHSGVDRVLGNLVPEFVKQGLRVDLLHIQGHGPFWRDLPEGARLVDLGAGHVNTSLPALVRYLRQHRPAALLSDKDKVNRAALWARRLARVQTRVTVRMGTTVSKNLARRRLWSRAAHYASIRVLYRWADGIIAPSQGAAEDLARIAGLPVSKVTVIPSPVLNRRLIELSEQPVAHPWFDEPAVPVILGVGELSGRKDFSTLIRAFALVRRERPCRLIIAGEGRQREKLTILAKTLGVWPDVELPGFVANPYAYMRHARVFALTSICEGAPVVLMEALATSTPVVATDCPSGPREILADGLYGALVPVGDVERLAQKLIEALIDPVPPHLLRQASERFSAARSADLYLQALGFNPKEAVDAA